MAKTINETTVNIRGTAYQLRTDMNAEVVTELAQYVDDKMREIDPRGTLPPGKVSVLTSLSIAGELKEAREASETDRLNIVDRLQHMHEMLDAALGNR